jgi:hypothetical protein
MTTYMHSNPEVPIRSLNQQAASYLAMGYHIELQDDNIIVLKKPAQKINHVFHLLMTLLTCGCWTVVWGLSMIKQSKEDIVTLTISEATLSVPLEQESHDESQQ